ncbi:MAG: hypothetical protein ABII09_01120 [Planctomycetota bacterium]
MEPVWLKEALFAGQTANGFKLGTATRLGWFWSRVNGCRIAYRGESMETVDFDDVLAVAEADASEIVLPDYVSHEPGRTYFYAVRCANRCGRIERTLAAAVKVSIGDDGTLRIGTPNSVFGLAAVIQRSGKVEIGWTYSPLEQAGNPVEMRVYGDEGTGEINYQEPVTLVPYKGKRFYRYESELPGDGRYRFVVRAVDAKGNERESMREVEAEIRDKSVESIEIVSVCQI